MLLFGNCFIHYPFLTFFIIIYLYLMKIVITESKLTEVQKFRVPIVNFEKFVLDYLNNGKGY
jgi:hypothetical protein